METRSDIEPVGPHGADTSRACRAGSRVVHVRQVAKRGGADCDNLSALRDAARGFVSDVSVLRIRLLEGRGSHDVPSLPGASFGLYADLPELWL